jgi:biotin synthase
LTQIIDTELARGESYASKFAEYAGMSIRGEELSRAQCLEVLNSPDEAMLDLLAATYTVRREFCGNKVHIHVLMNAKSGICPEDCGYCSQSAVSTAMIEKYPLVAKQKLLEGAQAAKDAQAKRFCIVTSGRAASWRDVNYLCDAVTEIIQEVGIKVCACVGLIDEEKARAFKEAGVDQLNHNLNTSENFSPSIVSSHTYADRMETLQAARSAGLELCSGAIFGMGEAQDDVIDVLVELRKLEPQSIPVNFLHAIDGTPLEGKDELSPQDCLRILCLARLLNPRQEIRVAGGREVNLRSLQPLSLYAANSLFVDGYLTTPGQNTDEAWAMIKDLGFEIEID